MIKNVVFDLGNVLLRFEPLEHVRAKLGDCGAVEQVYQEIFLSEEWALLDRGTISQEEAVGRMVARSRGNGRSIRRCMDNWYELLTPIEETVDILKEVKARGRRTYILSNFHLLSYENVASRYDFFRYFDGGVISCREKMVKPDREIYDTLIERYGINPNESLFIDDAKANIESAGKLGFATIHFDTPQRLHEELVEMGVLDE